MNKIVKAVKWYFLLAARSMFIAGFTLGVGLAMVVGLLLLIFNPTLYTGETVLALNIGLGLLIGTITYVVCRRFVSYSRDPILFFLAKDGKVVLDEEGKVTAGNPLWVRGGMGVIRVELADTNHTHVIDPSPPNAVLKIPLELNVLFKRGFDAQEVYERIVKAGYSSLDGLVRQRFLDALDTIDDLQRKLRRMRDYPLAKLEDELWKISPHFYGPDILSNIEKIGVKLTPEAMVYF